MFHEDGSRAPLKEDRDQKTDSRSTQSKAGGNRDYGGGPQGISSRDIKLSVPLGIGAR